MQPRTKRQKEVLDYVTRFMERYGHEPSYQQIARHLGVSSRGGVQRHIAALESLGLIRRTRDNGSFSIELPLRKIVNDKLCDIELTKVAENNGSYFVSERSTFTLSRAMIGNLEPDEIFAVQMPDDSLIAKCICEDDILFLERRAYARRGQVVVAEKDDGTFLFGLYYQHGRETEIRPANDGAETKIFPADEITVHGVMRGLLRPFPSCDPSD